MNPRAGKGPPWNLLARMPRCVVIEVAEESSIRDLPPAARST